MAGLFDDLLDQPRKSRGGLFDDLIDAPPPKQEDRPFWQDAAEIGRQFVGGVAVDLPKMAGNVIRRVSTDGGGLDDYGKSIVESANARAAQWEPNTQGEGLISGTLAKGARGLGPMIPAAVAGALTGGLGAGAVAAAQFGLSSAQETEDKLVEQGVPMDKATEAGWLTGAIQGPIEGIATAVGVRAFKPLAQAMGSGTAKTMTEFVSALTETAVLKPFAKGMGVNMLVQPGTEIAQDVGTEFVERGYGAKPQDAWEIAKDSAQGAVGMTALLGPFAFMAHNNNGKRAEALKFALENENATPELKAQAKNFIILEAKKAGVAQEDIAQWGILNSDSVDEAITQFSEPLSTPTNFTATPRGLIGGITNATAGPGFDARSVAGDYIDSQDLADLVQTEQRDLQVMRANIERDRIKQAELDQIPQIAAEQNQTQDVVKQAATLEGPSAFELALQEARQRKQQPEPDTAPAQPAGVLTSEPRIVERTADMNPMPKELAELQVDMDGGEVVRIANRNGKFAYTVIKDSNGRSNATSPPVTATVQPTSDNPATSVATGHEPAVRGLPADEVRPAADVLVPASILPERSTSDALTTQSTPAASTQPIGVTPIAEAGIPVTPTFDYTQNKAGNVTVKGDPAAIRSTFTGLKGATVFADGKPAGVMFGPTDSPAVLELLKPATTDTSVAPVGGEMKQPWQMTRAEWGKHNFDETQHKGLPSDYFSGYEFNAKKAGTSLINTTASGVEIRRGDYGIAYAFDGGKNVGMGDGKAFVVQPEYQKQGIGGALLKATYAGKPIGSRTAAGQTLIESFHKAEVTQAVAEGKPVPASVLADYPDSQPQEKPLATSSKAVKTEPIQAQAPAAAVNSSKEYLAKAEQARKDAEERSKAAPKETIIPANDKNLGVNDAGDLVYERADGSVYKMRNGKPDFGGDLSVKPAPSVPETATPATPLQAEVARIRRQDLPNDQKPDATPEEFDQVNEAEYQQSIKDGIRERLGLVAPEVEKPKASPFRSFLREYGIHKDHAQGVTGERGIKGFQRLPITFRNNGLHLDELALRAQERGYLTQADIDSDSDNGGTRKLAEMIQDEINGKRQVSSEFSNETAESAAERAGRAEIEGMADKLGLPYDATMDTGKLASMVNRVTTRLETPKPADRLLKPERVRQNAVDTALRIEKKRAEYEAKFADFAKHNIAEQDALLSVLTDEDGNPTINRRSEIDAQQAWADLHEQDTHTPEYPLARQAETPAPRQPEAGIVNAAANAPRAQQGSNEVPRAADEGQARIQDGLTAPTQADVLAQQAQREAEEQRKADGGDKPIERKVTADQVDLFNPQGSIFDAPAEPESKPAETYINGDRAEYTGNTQEIHGGKFYEVKFMEGAKQGQTGVTQRAPNGTGMPDNAPKSTGIVTPQIVPAKPADPISAAVTALQGAVNDLAKAIAPKEVIDKVNDNVVNSEAFPGTDWKGRAWDGNRFISDEARDSEMRPGYIGSTKNNAPYENRAGALGRLRADDYKLANTHEIVQVGKDGYAVRPKEGDYPDYAKTPGAQPAQPAGKIEDYSKWSVDRLRKEGGETISVSDALVALTEKRNRITDDQSNWTPRDKDGHPVSGVNLYTPEALRKLDDMGWAVQNLLSHKEKHGDAPLQQQAEAEKQPTVPLSSVIDAVNEKHGQGLTEADRVPGNVLDEETRIWSRLADGKATLEEFKASFENWVKNKDSIIELLTKNTKDQLLKMRGNPLYDRYKNEPKAELVNAMWRDGATQYVLARSFSHGMGKNAWLDGIRNMVDKTTEADLEQYAKDHKAAADAAVARVGQIAEAIKDPKTLADYQTWMRATMSGGKTFKEARMAMTPGQRATFDELTATESRGSRQEAKEVKQEQSMRAPGEALTATEIVKTKHTKHGHDLWQFDLNQRVSSEEFKSLVSKAKLLNGTYSSYRGNGAIPGWQFKSEAGAKAFRNLIAGDSTQAKDVLQANRDAYADDRSQSASERLNEMADRLDEKADASLNQNRKVNTSKRAGQAASAESAANSEKAMAATMRNIAQAITDGTAKFLDRVRQKTQVELLQTFIHTAKYDELRSKYESYGEQEKHRGEAPTSETADYAEFPTFTSYRSDLATLARQLLESDGTKLIGQRLMKVADDVTDSYLKFAKENFGKVAVFRTTAGGIAGFGSRDAAEASIARSGYNGKAIAYQVKRGEYTIILSPKEAVERGAWKGDGDKRITLSNDFGTDLVEKIGKAARRGSKVSVPWQFESALDKQKTLSRMGIETPAELRAALREFVSLREQTKELDKVKQLERAMVGRRNDGLDFFPTPESVTDEMISAAGIEPGMKVLEPSAGMGHIADRIREAGTEPDVGEMSGERRELLEAKGFNLVSSDFMEMEKGEGYDRIVMNPPFSDGRDIQHVQHAYTLLKPGGRIVAIMGESAFTNQSKKAQEFRAWLEQVGGTEEKLPEGSFNDPSLPVNTGANARMVVIDKGTAMYSRLQQDNQSRIIDTPIGDVNAAKLNSDVDSFWKVHFGDGQGNRSDHGRPVDVVSAYGGADRGSDRTGTVIKRGSPGTETVRWNESVAGQDGFITTAGQFGDAFIVDVIPKSLAGNWFGKIDFEQSSIISLSFREVADGVYELGVGSPLEGTKAYNLLKQSGRIVGTGQFDKDGIEYQKTILDSESKESTEFLSEAVRRFALHIGEIPTIYITRRDTGANPGARNLLISPEKVATKFSQGQTQNPTTVPTLEQAIRELTGKFLGNQLGKIVATTSSEIKSHWIAQVGNVNLESEGNAGKAQAFFDPTTKTIFLIADHIEAGTEQAVAAHELMHKHGKDVLGEAGWNHLHSVIDDWYKAAPGTPERAVYDYAADRVQAIGGGEKLSSQELFPYAVEGALKMGIKPSMSAKQGTVARWLESVRQNLKAVWGKITNKPETFKAQDLVDLAFAIAQRENNPDFTIRDQTDTPAFRAWFGSSKVVDSDGNPLVVYHGTASDITEFRRTRTGEFGPAIYTTSDPNEAAEYGIGAGSRSIGQAPVNVMPVYVSLKNPFTLGVTVFWKRYNRENDGDAEAVQRAIDDGFDGIIEDRVDYRGKKSFTHYIAFDPTQIKSSIGNNGDFSPTNPDIRYSKGMTNKDVVGNQGGRSADDITPGANFDVDRALRDMVGRNKFSDFDVAPEFDATVHDVSGPPLKQVLHEFALSKFNGKKWVSLSIGEHKNINGEVVFSSSLESGGYAKGTGIATKMYLAGLNVAQKRSIGWQSEGVRSDDSFAIYERLIKAGVPFREVDGVHTIEGAELAKVNLQEVSDKLAKKNESTAPDSGGAQFSRSVITGQALPQTWQAPDTSKMDDFIYLMQDKHVDTKRVMKAVRDAIGAIADQQDPYLQEGLFHGRAAMAVKEFLEKQVRPLITDLQARGVDMSDFEEYLHNRHAERRNVQVAKVNPAMQDGGSGIKTADARAYLAALPADKQRAYTALAAKVDQINRDTRALLVSSGLEKQETIDAWQAAYGDEYVPLMREEMENGQGIGQGFSVRGTSSKRAMGSDKPVANILANIMLAREKAITRSEKRKIGEALYGLVLKAPNPSFWFAIDPALQNVKNPNQIMATQLQLIDMGMDPADAEAIAKEPTTRYINPKTGLVESRINPAMRSAENVLAVRIDGEDKYVFFNKSDERAMRMAKALKNLDADQLGQVMGTVAKMTRYFAAVNTQYNPVFGVTNIIRDVQTAMLNLQSTELKGKQKDVLKNILPALRGIYIDLRDHRAGKQPTSAYAQVFEEFQREGGATGYRDMYANAEERADAIKAEIAGMNAGKLKQAGKGVMGWLSDYNEAMENAVRVSAYMAAKEHGMSNQQAASLAKNLTVNFNRKGNVALQAGAIFAFFNASVQGSARMGQTLFEGGKLSGVGKQIITGGLLLGSMQALLLAAAGFDDDEPPDFVRERNLVIPIGGKKYVTIPMPLGFHVIPNLARIPTEWAMGGFKNTPKRIGQLFGLLADGLNPIGSSTAIQTLSPTIIDPFVALSENKDWTGKPIAKKDFDSMHPTAGHTRAKDTATPWAKFLSKAVNYATGGTEYKPGVMSPTPDQIDYVVGQLTGGVGRELGKLAQVGGATIQGDEIPLYKVPLVGRFVGTTEGQAAESSRFYENLKSIGTHKAQIDGLKRDHKGGEIGAYVRDNPEARMLPMATKFQEEVSKLNHRKRELIKQEASAERIKIINMQITARMKQFNDQVHRMEESAK